MNKTILGKLGGLRKEYFPTREEVEENKRLEEEKKRQEEEERIRQIVKEWQRMAKEREEQREEEKQRAVKEREKQKEKKRQKAARAEEKRIRQIEKERKRAAKAKKRWLLRLNEKPSVKDLKVFNQKQLAAEKLFILKNDYKCLIQQKNKLPQKKYNLNNKLNELRLKKNKSFSSYERTLIGSEIERVHAEIRKLSIEMRKLDKQIGTKIKITESKIEQLTNDLSSDKFMIDQEIKRKLLKEEKDKIRIERLRDEVRKEFFEKEFQAIPEDNRIRFISDEVKEFVWRRDQGKCVKCSSQDSLEFDHIIPFSKGGSNTARNIQLLCEKCNRIKHDSI